jgi:hypothetical protein
MILGLGEILAKRPVVPLIEGELESAVTVENTSVMGRTTPPVRDIVNLFAWVLRRPRPGWSIPEDAFLNQFCGDRAK